MAFTVDCLLYSVSVMRYDQHKMLYGCNFRPHPLFALCHAGMTLLESVKDFTKLP